MNRTAGLANPLLIVTPITMKKQSAPRADLFRQPLDFLGRLGLLGKAPCGRGCRAAEGCEAGEGSFVRRHTPHPAQNSLRSFLATLSRKGRGYSEPAAPLLPIQHDRQNTKTPPPVLPDESSAPRKNIYLSESKKL